MKRLQVFRIVLYFVLALFLLHSNQTPNPPRLKIEPGMHEGKIWKIAKDTEERFLASASEDRTVKIWKVGSKGKLSFEKTIYPNFEKKTDFIKAIAMSPDGNQIALGHYDGDLSIYDRISGNLIQSIKDQDLSPNQWHTTTIQNLKFSKDGKYLFLTKGQNNGLTILQKEKEQYKIIAKDWSYSTYLQGFDFYEFENKTLLVTGAGAKLKVYNLSQDNLKEVQSWSLNCGEVYSIAFSQDGKELAVGCRYKPAVAIYEVKQTEKEIILQFSFYPNLENLKEATSLCYNDGYLYSTDSYKYTNKKDSNTIRRWENNGRGGFIDIVASHSGVWACLPSKYGGIYYAATFDFGLGRINAEGKREYLLLPPDEQYKHIGENFAVSHDGRNFQFSKEKNLLLYFDKENKRLEKISYPKTELKTAIQKTNTLHITNWQNSDKPVVNNIALRLENREISLSASIHPNEKEFVIGTNYWIRYYNSDGKLLWKTKEMLPNVHGVVISGNGEFVVAALGDGTIRWFRTKDGEPLLAFMSSQTPNAEGEWTWILWTAKPKEGYYDTIFGGENFLGWAFYLSEDLFEYYTIDNYRKEFYRPDAIEKVFETFDINLAFQAAEKEYGIKAISNPNLSAPPLIDIKFELEGSVSREQNIDIALNIRDNSKKIMKINLLNNGRVVNHYPITKKGIPSSVPIELEPGENKIQILAETESNTLQSNIIKIYYNGTARKVESKLYVFSIGISKYSNITSLQYADKDAEVINKILKKQEGKPEDKPENKLWKEVVVKEEYTLLNEKATKSEIIKQLAKFIQEPTENDVSILFFSGHGGSYANSYYLLPHDFDDSSLEKIASTGIDINFLLTQIFSLKGRIILFVDACYSGNIKGDLTLLSKLPNEKKIAVFASSRSYQTSLEINGGLMVRAFQDIIANGDGVDRISKKITLASLEHPLRTQVKLLSKEKNQKPSILIPEDLEDLEIAIPKNL